MEIARNLYRDLSEMQRSDMTAQEKLCIDALISVCHHLGKGDVVLSCWVTHAVLNGKGIVWQKLENGERKNASPEERGAFPWSDHWHFSNYAYDATVGIRAMLSDLNVLLPEPTTDVSKVVAEATPVKSRQQTNKAKVHAAMAPALGAEWFRVPLDTKLFIFDKDLLSSHELAEYNNKGVESQGYGVPHPAPDIKWFHG